MKTKLKIEIYRGSSAVLISFLNENRIQYVIKDEPTKDFIKFSIYPKYHYELEDIVQQLKSL